MCTSKSAEYGSTRSGSTPYVGAESAEYVGAESAEYVGAESAEYVGALSFIRTKCGAGR
jgi:hypothetical protein